MYLLITHAWGHLNFSNLNMIQSLLTINMKYKNEPGTPLFKVIVKLEGNEIPFSHYQILDGILYCDQPGNVKGPTTEEPGS